MVVVQRIHSFRYKWNILVCHLEGIQLPNMEEPRGWHCCRKPSNRL